VIVKLLAVPASPEVHDKVVGVMVAPEPAIVTLPAEGAVPFKVTVPVVLVPVVPVVESARVAMVAVAPLTVYERLLGFESPPLLVIEIVLVPVEAGV
jgi:hypothetical protein